MANPTPVAAFDSGVGSYSIVKIIRENLPREHLVYLADRVSFPYGEKTHEELKKNILSRIKWLETNYSPKLIVVASNTPSIQVLEEIKQEIKTPLIGVFPPVEKAVQISRSKHIAILTTKGVVESKEVDDFLKKKNFPQEVRFEKVNASDLVALVEPGIFLSDPLTTENIVNRFLSQLLEKYPAVDVMTLSNTHLPFLKEYFTKLYPNLNFLDPALDVATEVEDYLKNNNLLNDQTGSLTLLSTVDETRGFTIDNLQKTFSNIGLEKEIQEVKIPPLG